MTTSTKNQLLNRLHNKFAALYVLNCTDILFTYTLIKTGYFYEANYIMRNIVSNPFLSILVKVFFPAILILTALIYANGEIAELKMTHIITNIILGAYIIINLMHISYSMLILFHLI